MRLADSAVQMGIVAKLDSLGTLGEVLADPKQAGSDRYVVVGNDVEIPQQNKTQDMSEVIHTLVCWAVTMGQAKTDRGIVSEALTSRDRSNFITIAAPFYIIYQLLEAAPGVEGRTLSVRDESSGQTFYGAPVRVRFLVGQSSTS